MKNSKLIIAALAAFSLLICTQNVKTTLEKRKMKEQNNAYIDSSLEAGRIERMKSKLM